MPTETIYIDDRWSDDLSDVQIVDFWNELEIKVDRIEAKLDRIIAELDDDEAAKARFRELMGPK